MAELRPGDVRVYMKRCLDLARTIDPAAWRPDAPPEAWMRRILSALSAKRWIEMDADKKCRMSFKER